MSQTFENKIWICLIRLNISFFQVEVQPLSATELNHLGRVLQGQFGQLEAQLATQI